MTGKRCTDCRHTRGIGDDFWCGEGHTEYEVFGGTTDCPYYEYHDWSKGVPSKIVKRFEVTFNDSDFHLKDNKTGEELKLVDEKVCYDYIADRWNALHKENEYLHKYNTKLQKQPLLFDVQTIPDTMEIMEANTQLEKENKQLRTKNNAYIQDIEVFKEENQRLKLLLSLQEEVVTDAIDNLMELPSVSKYLVKQWLECAEKYDSIEELQNEFKERLIELEDLE